jgi:predicted O-methyltransferase YrrM
MTASNSKGHGMHSPFVFDFIQNVLNNRAHYIPPSKIEQLREQLLGEKEVIPITDLGAGSRSGNANDKKVSQLAATALKPRKYAQLLFRLVRHYHPSRIVELGTSLGITTAYLSMADPAAQLITIEGSPAIAQIARDNFRKLNCTNIELMQGDFDVLLPSVLNKLPGIDLAYIDGNHRYHPTINYFNLLLQKAHNHTILVFDDIHWSKEMEHSWEEIKAHPSVQYTIDIFFLGFVFFRQEFKVKQHFKIRF